MKRIEVYKTRTRRRRGRRRIYDGAEENRFSTSQSSGQNLPDETGICSRIPQESHVIKVTDCKESDIAASRVIITSHDFHANQKIKVWSGFSCLSNVSNTKHSARLSANRPTTICLFKDSAPRSVTRIESPKSTGLCSLVLMPVDQRATNELLSLTTSSEFAHQQTNRRSAEVTINMSSLREAKDRSDLSVIDGRSSGNKSLDMTLGDEQLKSLMLWPPKTTLNIVCSLRVALWLDLTLPNDERLLARLRQYLHLFRLTSLQWPIEMAQIWLKKQWRRPAPDKPTSVRLVAPNSTLNKEPTAVGIGIEMPTQMSNHKPVASDKYALKRPDSSGPLAGELLVESSQHDYYCYPCWLCSDGTAQTQEWDLFVRFIPGRTRYSTVHDRRTMRLRVKVSLVGSDAKLIYMVVRQSQVNYEWYRRECLCRRADYTLVSDQYKVVIFARLAAIRRANFRIFDGNSVNITQSEGQTESRLNISRESIDNNKSLRGDHKAKLVWHKDSARTRSKQESKCCCLQSLLLSEAMSRPRPLVEGFNRQTSSDWRKQLSLRPTCYAQHSTHALTVMIDVWCQSIGALVDRTQAAIDSWLQLVDQRLELASCLRGIQSKESLPKLGAECMLAGFACFRWPIDSQKLIEELACMQPHKLAPNRLSTQRVSRRKERKAAGAELVARPNPRGLDIWSRVSSGADDSSLSQVDSQHRATFVASSPENGDQWQAIPGQDLTYSIGADPHRVLWTSTILGVTHKTQDANTREINKFANCSSWTAHLLLEVEEPPVAGCSRKGSSHDQQKSRQKLMQPNLVATKGTRPVERLNLSAKLKELSESRASNGEPVGVSEASRSPQLGSVATTINQNIASPAHNFHRQMSAEFKIILPLLSLREQRQIPLPSRPTRSGLAPSSTALRSLSIGRIFATSRSKLPTAASANGSGHRNDLQNLLCPQFNTCGEGQRVAKLHHQEEPSCPHKPSLFGKRQQMGRMPLLVLFVYLIMISLLSDLANFDLCASNSMARDGTTRCSKWRSIFTDLKPIIQSVSCTSLNGHHLEQNSGLSAPPQEGPSPSVGFPLDCRWPRCSSWLLASKQRADPSAEQRSQVSDSLSRDEIVEDLSELLKSSDKPERHSQRFISHQAKQSTWRPEPRVKNHSRRQVEMVRENIDFFKSMSGANQEESRIKSSSYPESSGRIGQPSERNMSQWSQVDSSSTLQASDHQPNQLVQPLAIPLRPAYRWPFIGLVGFMFLGAAGNILVCMAVWRERRLQTATNYFLLSLAVADLLVCTLVMPFGIIYEFYGFWPYDWRICNLWVTSDVLTCSSSILHMCCISVGRYIGIRNPLHARQTNLFVSRRAVLWRISIAWASAGVIASPITMMSLYDHKNIVPHDNECAISNKYFMIFGSLLAFFIPMFVMVPSYVMTVRLLSRRAKFIGNDSHILTNSSQNQTNGRPAIGNFYPSPHNGPILPSKHLDTQNKSRCNLSDPPLGSIRSRAVNNSTIVAIFRHSTDKTGNHQVFRPQESKLALDRYSEIRSMEHLADMSVSLGASSSREVANSLERLDNQIIKVGSTMTTKVCIDDQSREFKGNMSANVRCLGSPEKLVSKVSSDSSNRELGIYHHKDRLPLPTVNLTGSNCQTETKVAMAKGLKYGDHSGRVHNTDILDGNFLKDARYIDEMESSPLIKSSMGNIRVEAPTREMNSIQLHVTNDEPNQQFQQNSSELQISCQNCDTKTSNEHTSSVCELQRHSCQVFNGTKMVISEIDLYKNNNEKGDLNSRLTSTNRMINQTFDPKGAQCLSMVNPYAGLENTIFKNEGLETYDCNSSSDISQCCNLVGCELTTEQIQAPQASSLGNVSPNSPVSRHQDRRETTRENEQEEPFHASQAADVAKNNRVAFDYGQNDGLSQSFASSRGQKFQDQERKFKYETMITLQECNNEDHPTSPLASDIAKGCPNLTRPQISHPIIEDPPEASDQLITDQGDSHPDRRSRHNHTMSLPKNNNDVSLLRCPPTSRHQIRGHGHHQHHHNHHRNHHVKSETNNRMSVNQSHSCAHRRHGHHHHHNHRHHHHHHHHHHHGNRDGTAKNLSEPKADPICQKSDTLKLSSVNGVNYAKRLESSRKKSNSDISLGSNFKLLKFGQTRHSSTRCVSCSKLDSKKPQPLIDSQVVSSDKRTINLLEDAKIEVLHAASQDQSDKMKANSAPEQNPFGKKTHSIIGNSILMAAIPTLSSIRKSHENSNIPISRNSSNNSSDAQSNQPHANFSSTETNEPQMIRYLGSSMQVRSEQKATKVLGVVFFTFVICWSPFFIINFAQAFVDREFLSRYITNEMLTTFQWLGYISSTINPVIYTVFNRNFRLAFKRLVVCGESNEQFSHRNRNSQMNKSFRFSQYGRNFNSSMYGGTGRANYTNRSINALATTSSHATTRNISVDNLDVANQKNELYVAEPPQLASGELHKVINMDNNKCITHFLKPENESLLNNESSKDKISTREIQTKANCLDDLANHKSGSVTRAIRSALRTTSSLFSAQ